MSVEAVKVGIVGLGRWAKVLARAAAKSDQLKIVAGYSRSEEKRQAFEPMDAEKAANPFLRADLPEVAAAVGLAGKPAAQVFAEIRARKNKF